MFTSPKARAPFQMDAIVPRCQGSTRAIHHLCTFIHTARRTRPWVLVSPLPSRALERAHTLHWALTMTNSPTGDPMVSEADQLHCGDCGRAGPSIALHPGR